MTSQIIIPDQAKVEKIKNAMRDDGIDKLHVLSDFDRTLTYPYNGNESTPSLISLIRKGKYLTPEYSPAAYALYDKYAPLETDPRLSRVLKFSAMQEWWEKHFKLLADSGLTKQVIDEIVAKHEIRFRKSANTLLDWTFEHHVPFIIMSASITSMIEGILAYENLLYDNIHVISNQLEFDQQGKFIGIKPPVVHSLNKYEIILKDFPIFKTVESRKNVLLIGDTVDDVGMVEGFEYKNLLKIGFLNERGSPTEAGLIQYKQAFDIILTGDPSMKYICGLLSEIFP